MNEVMAALAREHSQVTFVQLEAEAVPEVSEKYGISSVPTFLFFKNSQNVDRLDGAHAPELTQKKRLCRLLDTIPGQAAAQLRDCAMDLDPRQKLLPDSAPWAAKQNSVVLENHGSKGISQPCPRCVAGESGHFSHILGS
ncbi:hypothetical protein EK904_005028 [Melospiza melodia maxima]|nr:hypothetical protein EK904_005028 [Melospiza melodia maxima]